MMFGMNGSISLPFISDKLIAVSDKSVNQMRRSSSELIKHLISQK